MTLGKTTRVGDAVVWEVARYFEGGVRGMIGPVDR